MHKILVPLIFLLNCVTVAAAFTSHTAYCASFDSVVTSTALYSSSSSSSSSDLDVKSLLYQEHEKMLVERGRHEGELMQHFTAGIQANVVRGAGSGGGFGFGSQTKSPSASVLQQEAKAHAQVLKREGVVRIDHVLPAALADQLRQFVMELRRESEALVNSGAVKPKERFADVLLKDRRCDLTLPLISTPCGITADALGHVLCRSPVGDTFATLLGKDAVLYEFSCLISDPGSPRQVMHPDTPYASNTDEPVLYTCFVALQDITIDMGPTTWMPGTHTLEAHQLFQNEQTKDALLQKGPAVLGLLPKGCCGIFDSRLLHCGGGNTNPADANIVNGAFKQRAVFYCSFRNPNVPNAGNPGSIRPNLIGQWTLQNLQKQLSKHLKNNNNKSSVFRSD